MLSAKQNKTKQNKTKQNKTTKQNRTASRTGLHKLINENSPEPPSHLCFFLFFNLYLFLTERETECEQGRNRERGDTESEAGSRL